MKPEPAWPLHPPPGDVDTLGQYIQSLARQYGVTFESFCFYALNIAHYDEEARSFIRPTEDVLERLAETRSRRQSMVQTYSRNWLRTVRPSSKATSPQPTNSSPASN